MIDFQTLTMGEVARIEELSGQGIGSIAEDDTPKGLALAAIAFIVKRRQDQKFTWNAAQAMTLSEVQELLGLKEEVEEDSDEGKDEASAETVKPSRRRSSSTSA